MPSSTAREPLSLAEPTPPRPDDSIALILDLADTEQLAVMAVQRADGAFARQEAERLAALVQAHALDDPSAG